MPLGPTDADLIARARSDMRMGLPIVLSDGPALTLAVPAETLRPDRLAALTSLGSPVLAVTARRAETLKARAYDGDLARIVLPDDADCGWIRAVADPAQDLDAPLKGPFRTLRDGDPALARTALRLAKGARLLPAVVIMDVEADALPEGLSRLDLATLGPALDDPAEFHDVIFARVPTRFSGDARVHVFRPSDGGEEHYAVEIGRPERDKPVLVRLHSACFTGDVIGSLKCDCGPQLSTALDTIGAEGAGVLLYLNQEGRGIGLANKMRAYSLQDQGFDTVEANHRLGFEDDERDFRIGAAILSRLGIAQVRLMTNNPAKVDMLVRSGLKVAERVPLKAGRNPLNEDYLDVKARKSGHLL